MAYNNFDQGYSNQMDRYSKSKTTQFTTKISPKDLAESAAFIDMDVMGKIKGSIFRGASKVEVAFFGQGKTSQQPSPETLSPDLRRDIRDMTLINDVQLTTHACVQVTGLSGIIEDRYDESARRNSINEIKKAIQFASDVSTGGAVVFHAGEFQRIPSHAKNLPMELKTDFKIHQFFDPEQKKVIRVPDNFKVSIPIGEDNKPLSDNNINPKKDENGLIVTEEMNFDQWKKLKDIKTIDHDADLFRDFYKLSKYGDRKEMEGRMMQNIQESKLFRLKAKEAEQNAFDTENETEKKKYLAQQKIYSAQADSLEASASGLNEKIKEIDKSFKKLKDLKEFALSKTGESLGELGIFAMEQTEIAKQKRASENIKNTFKPLFVSPENVYPELYGGSLSELKDIIDKGRENMILNLVNKMGFDKKEAEQLAKTHIKATFDTGHLNIWWKNFNEQNTGIRDENERNQKFKEWIIAEFKELAKDERVGHIHLTDNLGYDDEHLVVGEGTTPITDILKVIENDPKLKPLLKEMVVESGVQNFKTILHDTWGKFNSPIYSLDKKSTANFKELASSYFEKRSYVSNFPYEFKELRQKQTYLSKSSYTGLNFG